MMQKKVTEALVATEEKWSRRLAIVWGAGRCGEHRRSSRRSDLEVVGMLQEMVGVETDPKQQSLFQHRLDPPVSQAQVLVGQMVPAQVLLVAAAAGSGHLGWAAGQGKPGS